MPIVGILSGSGASGGEETPVEGEQDEGPQAPNATAAGQDVTAASQQEALEIALQRHGAVNDPALIETIPTYGKNPNLLGPNGEPYEDPAARRGWEHHRNTESLLGAYFSDVEPPWSNRLITTAQMVNTFSIENLHELSLLDKSGTHAR